MTLSLEEQFWNEIRRALKRFVSVNGTGDEAIAAMTAIVVAIEKRYPVLAPPREYRPRLRIVEK